MINLVNAYLNRNDTHCWIFSTRGLCAVAQDELVFVVDENTEHSNDIISDLVTHIHQIYIDATKGLKILILKRRLIINLLKVRSFAIWVYHCRPIQQHFLVQQIWLDFFIYQILQHAIRYFLRHHIYLVFQFIDQNYLQLNAFH